VADPPQNPTLRGSPLGFLTQVPGDEQADAESFEEDFDKACAEAFGEWPEGAWQAAENEWAESPSNYHTTTIKNDLDDASHVPAPVPARAPAPRRNSTAWPYPRMDQCPQCNSPSLLYWPTVVRIVLVLCTVCSRTFKLQEVWDGHTGLWKRQTTVMGLSPLPPRETSS